MNKHGVFLWVSFSLGPLYLPALYVLFLHHRAQCSLKTAVYMVETGTAP